jgi:hypothetical protein
MTEHDDEERRRQEEIRALNKAVNPGAKITEMDATDLVGRLVTNANGAEFLVQRLSFEARTGTVWFWLEAFDDETGEPNGDVAGIPTLEGWTIHQPLDRRK